MHLDAAAAAEQRDTGTGTTYFCSAHCAVAAVLLDTIADAAAAAGVAATGAVILVTHGWYWLDPAVALVIAVIVAYHALALIRKVLHRIRPSTANSKART
jgi:Co/Zn/Cd efflux system component